MPADLGDFLTPPEFAAVTISTSYVTLKTGEELQEMIKSGQYGKEDGEWRRMMEERQQIMNGIRAHGVGKHGWLGLVRWTEQQVNDGVSLDLALAGLTGAHVGVVGQKT